jgi:hypothetical protein
VLQFQAAEREQERDEYQHKLNHLEAMIKERDRKQGASDRLSTQVSYHQTSVNAMLKVTNKTVEARTCLENGFAKWQFEL